MIPTQVERVPYLGDGVTTNFAFNASVLNAADIVVVERVIATGVDTVLTQGNQYTVLGTPDAVGRYVNGVTIVATVAPANTVYWIIYQDPALTQGVDLTENGLLPVESQIELPLDRLTVIAQRLNSRISRTLRQPDGDPADIGMVPDSVTRASKFLGFDALGNPIAAAGVTAGLNPVSAFADTLLDDANAETARNTLQIGSHPSYVRGLVGRRKTGATNVFQVSKLEAAVLVKPNAFGLQTSDFVYLKWPNFPTVMEVDASIAGPVVGGRDQAGAFTNPTNINVYLIWNGTTAGLIASASPHYNGPALPSGYTHFAFLTIIPFTTEFADAQAVGSHVLLSRAAISGLTSTSLVFVSTAASVPGDALAILGDVQLSGTSTGGGLLDATITISCSANGYAGAVGRVRLFQSGINSTTQASGHTPCRIPLTTSGFFYQVAIVQGTSISGTFQVLGYIVPNGDWS